MNTELVSWIIGSYFAALLFITYLTARGATTETFFNANRQAPWPVVAFGMIGASLSGVTFISIPGMVATSGFGYLQVVFGYLLGYVVIAQVLMPLYYRLNLVSIYEYLDGRFGFWTYKTGAFFFLLSRTIGSSFRLFIVAFVLQLFLFGPLGVNFYVTVFLSIALIWLYTFRGGIKTVMWTDIFQTVFMLLSVGATIVVIGGELGLSGMNIFTAVQESKYSQVFFWDGGPQNFFRQFFSGAFIAIVMTGLDQDMMQKNLSCRNIQEAQKNMYSFSAMLVLANLFFLALGALLYMFAEQKGIQLPLTDKGLVDGDKVFPTLAYQHLGLFAGVTFLVGIVAAAYSSADSALTALTTSFCVDFLEFNKTKTGEARKRMRRIQVHLGFSVLLFLMVVAFSFMKDDSVINAVFKAAGYTYGPLLGLFAFGLFTKLQIRDGLAPFVCALSPAISFLLNYYSEALFNGYKFGFELLMVNGGITFLGLLAITKWKED